MRIDREGHVYPTYRLKPERALATKYLEAQGAKPGANVPPTYLIFLRGESHGVNLFEDLDIPRTRALSGGQRYEWFRRIDWDTELDVTATVLKITEKASRSGPLWFADVEFQYRDAQSGELALREITRIIKRG